MEYVGMEDETVDEVELACLLGGAVPDDADTDAPVTAENAG